MFSDNDILREVKDSIQEILSSKQPVQAAWLTTKVVSLHPDINGSDADFYITCAYGHVRDKVREVLRKYKDSDNETPDPQIVLPGFERLQPAYLVDRIIGTEPEAKPESVLVRIDQLTAGEIRAKIDVYQTMGRGCFIHAAELQRYLEQREETMAV